MPVRIGNTLLSKVFSGNNEITKIFVGNTLIYENIDSDASAFITAASITNATQITAIDTLVKGLKTNGIWSKMKAIYPFVGGTANSHKFNLKDPRDLDAAFRLQFFGGITHDANGMKGNGTNGYADTFFVPSVRTIFNSEHLSIYSTSNNNPINNDAIDIGSFSSFGSASYLEIRGTSSQNRTQTRLNSDLVTFVQSQPDAKGYFITRKITSNNASLFKNGNLLINGNSGGSLPNSKVFIGNSSINNQPWGAWSNQNYAFATMGDGLTDTEATNLYNIVQAYQTTLNRQV